MFSRFFPQQQARRTRSFDAKRKAVFIGVRAEDSFAECENLH
jgi:hypothetical protein